jgi:hypothetical protein
MQVNFYTYYPPRKKVCKMGFQKVLNNTTQQQQKL